MAKRAKRGQPAQLSVESPHWVRYVDVLKDMVGRYGSGRLAAEKLDAAFEARAIRCKLEARDEPDRVDFPTGALLTRHKTELVQPSVRVAVVVAIHLTSGNLADGWEDELEITLDGQPRQGELFLWRPDRMKYFGIQPAQEPVQDRPTQEPVPKPLVKSGRMLKKVWVQQVVEILKLRRDFPDASANAIAEELELMLCNADQHVPSKLWELADQVFTFDDNPLPRPPDKDSKLKQARKRQKGK